MGAATSEISLYPAEVDALLFHVQSIKATTQDTHEETVQTLAARIKKVKIRIGRLTDAMVDGVIERDAFQDRRRSLLEELTCLTKKNSRSETETDDGIADLAIYLEPAKTASFQYETGTVDENGRPSETQSAGALLG